MNRKLMLLDKKNHTNHEKIIENLSIKFLKKRMKKLNDELEFMSGFVFRLRHKINHQVRLNSLVNDGKNFDTNPSKPDQSRSGVYI